MCYNVKKIREGYYKIWSMWGCDGTPNPNKINNKRDETYTEEWHCAQHIYLGRDEWLLYAGAISCGWYTSLCLKTLAIAIELSVGGVCLLIKVMIMQVLEKHLGQPCHFIPGSLTSLMSNAFLSMGSMMVTTIAMAAPDKLYFLHLENKVNWNRDSLLFIIPSLPLFFSDQELKVAVVYW